MSGLPTLSTAGGRIKNSQNWVFCEFFLLLPENGVFFLNLTTYLTIIGRERVNIFPFRIHTGVNIPV